MVASIPPEDQFTRWRSEYETDILVSLASLAGERMFFNNDSSSGVSGDLESATTVASFMEGFWGMGSTVSSYSTAKRLEVGSPGGGAGGRKKKGQDPEADMRRALADRIEDNLNGLLGRVEEIIAENRLQVLSLAHALETYKTLTGEDVVAVIERTQGPFVDGRAYADPGLMRELEDYHLGAAVAHREHGKIMLSMPEAPRAPVLAASAAKGWLVAPDPDPLDIRDHGNGSEPEDAPGPASPLDPGAEPGPPNGSGPAPGEGPPGGS
jgi:cell division protease FtsH